MKRNWTPAEVETAKAEVQKIVRLAKPFLPLSELEYLLLVQTTLCFAFNNVTYSATSQSGVNQACFHIRFRL